MMNFLQKILLISFLSIGLSISISSLYSFDNFNIDDKIKEYEDYLRKKNLDPLNLKIKMNEKEMDGWKGLRLRLGLFREAAKQLYDPTRSAFNKTKAESSNPASFTATSSPGSKPGNFSLEILQIAKEDKIASKKIKKDYKFKGSNFTIQSGEKKAEFDFSKGGNLADLNNVFDKSMNDVIEHTLIQVDSEHYMLVIKGKKKGEKNKLTLMGDDAFFTELGFYGGDNKIEPVFISLIDNMKEKIKGDYKIEKVEQPKKEKSPAQSNKPEKEDENANKLEAPGDILILDPKSEIRLPLVNPLKTTETSLLEFEIKVDDKKEEKKEEKDKKDEKDAKKEKDVLKIGSINKLNVDEKKEIIILDKPLIPMLKKKEEKKEEKKEDEPNKQFLNIVDMGDKELLAQEFSDSKGQWKPIKIQTIELFKQGFIKKLILKNSYDKKTLSIRKVKFHDPGDPNKKVSYNYIDKAQDAKIIHNGVEVKREDNQIDDLIRGVNISLKSPTVRPETVKTTRDYEEVIKQIQSFLDEYNNVMLFIDNAKTFVPTVRTLEEFEKQEEEYKRKSYEEKQYMQLSGEYFKGLMKGDRQIGFLKRDLEYTMKGTPYPRDVEKKIKLLVEIGFKLPNPLESDMDKKNAKAGYLSLDHKILEAKLETNFEEIKDLFAHSTNDDPIKDNGIAVNLVKIADAHAKRAVKGDQGASSKGTIEAKVDMLESRIKYSKRRLVSVERRTETKITTFKRKMAKLEEVQRRAEMKRKEMEMKLGGLKQGQ